MTAWAGRLFLGNGHMLYAGPVGPTSAHAHHAFQIVVAESGSLTLRSEDREVVTDVAIIPSDATHSIVVGTMSAIMLYVDPDTVDGRCLRALHVMRKEASHWREAAAGLGAVTGRASPTDAAGADALRRTILDALVGPTVRPIPQHPALVRAVRELPQRLDRPLRLPAIAAELGISESRLAHLFGEQLGMPFRSYVAWIRLRSAGRAVQAGRTLTQAAHHAGFADVAHLSRTFRRMFGIAPSEITGVVEWIVGATE
jgi:AraC-like DNA-binding protein